MPSSRLEIDLGAIERNLGVVRRITEPGPATSARPAKPHHVNICAVLKQDAYGAGAVRIAKRLVAGGIDMIGVYALDEARALAESVPHVHILILKPIYGIDRSDAIYRHLIAGRIHLAVHGPDQFAAVADLAARLGAQIPIHVQVDTGLSRGGSRPDESLTLIQRIVASQRIRLAGLMTHFASPCSDDAFTREQARRFRDFIESVRPCIKSGVEQGHRSVARMGEMVVHAANTLAMFRSRSYHGTMVRVGQCLLGYAGADVEDRAAFEFADELDNLEPAVRWVSSVVHVQDIPEGWPVGYGSTWTAPRRPDGRNTRIALIPVGYADGLPRNLGGGHPEHPGSSGPGWVAFTGRAYSPTVSERATDSLLSPEIVYAPIVGRVSMDQITVDVTDVPESHLRLPRSAPTGNAELGGSEVELYSRLPGSRNFLPDMAAISGTITHDLLCRVSPRVERTYKVSTLAEPTPQPATLPVVVRMPAVAERLAVPA
ncbi:MAG TPA: alanine racemase [Phycisphaerales bacterium]|nr:alanine racemase [Phycisphaerales bacterium]